MELDATQRSRLHGSRHGTPVVARGEGLCANRWGITVHEVHPLVLAHGDEVVWGDRLNTIPLDLRMLDMPWKPTHHPW